MKRAVICVDNPQDYIDQLTDYSIMIINPKSTPARLQYLIDRSDYSILISGNGTLERNGGDHGNERVLWYTSGTTGDSKFYSFTQAQLDIMATRICRAYNITANDRYVSIMGLWHAHGQGFYWATKMAGCQQEFLSIKDIRRLPEMNPTFITAIPDLLDTISSFTIKNLRFVRSASAALSPTLYHKLAEKFQVPIIEAFGMTESLSQCFTNPLYGQQRVGTVGLPDGVEVNIVEGKLFISGPTVASDGWLDTGDLASVDHHGYYKILGRHRDQLNIKGLKVNPIGIENRLMDNIPGMTDCVVFGTNALKCFWVGECDPNKIRSYLIELGSHCKPVLLERVDVIPVSPSGKISRTWLNSQFS